MDVLHILQLSLHRATVTTKEDSTPGHDRSITENSSESIVGGLGPLHVLQTLLHSTAVTTIGSQHPRSQQIHHQ